MASISIFEYRKGWRAQVRGAEQRRTRDFRTKGEARDWANRVVAEAQDAKAPELGGPTQATLAGALARYAELYTIRKRGRKGELNRINRYLRAAQLPTLKAVNGEGGTFTLVSTAPAAAPASANLPALQAPVTGVKSFDGLLATRRGLRVKTYAAIAALASSRMSTITCVDILEFMATMTSEGLATSTIQKEIALLKHLCNCALDDWEWLDFRNPCSGIKLGHSGRRFVHLSREQSERFHAELAKCENPYFWPLVDIAIYMPARKSSLLKLRREDIDLEHRIAMLHETKTGTVTVPIAQRALTVLQGMPQDPSGRVFPMSSNAVTCIWNRVRKAAGLPALQFRDLRHLGGTHYARRLGNSHVLRQILGHKTTYMAEIYVNLVNDELLEHLDETEPDASKASPLPPAATTSDQEILNRKRGERLLAGRARAKALRELASAPGAAVPPARADNVIPMFSEAPPVKVVPGESAHVTPARRKA